MWLEKGDNGFIIIFKKFKMERKKYWSFWLFVEKV
jgi:ABC-type microcin C transport system permease subunit YejE